MAKAPVIILRVMCAVIILVMRLTLSNVLREAESRRIRLEDWVC